MIIHPEKKVSKYQMEFSSKHYILWLGRQKYYDK